MGSTPLGRHGPRSRCGCTTCRTRKVKCDEQRPECSKCAQGKYKCEWDQPVQKRRTAARHFTKPSAKSRVSAAAQLAPAIRRSGHESTLETANVDAGVQAENLEIVLHRDICLDLEADPRERADDHGPLLSAAHIPLSNSLTLTSQDIQAFNYVAESLVVLRFGKPWKWSMLSYIHSKLACREAGVMRAFIAVASMELSFLELLKHQDSTPTRESIVKIQNLKGAATMHLHSALQDLSSMLDRLSSSEHRVEDVDALFSMWFLILHVGLFDPELVSASHVHLNGIRSFLGHYNQGNVARKEDLLPPVSQQLLLFIAYHDCTLALGNLNGGQLSLDLLSAPAESPVAYDQIFEQARRCLPKVWGTDYPIEELLDDIENYRGLSCLTICQKLKLSTWKLGVAAAQGKAVEITRRRLWSKIEEVGERFCDLLILARKVRASNGRRVIWTIYHAFLDYHALKVLFTCISGEDPYPLWLDGSLSELLAVAYKAIDEQPRQVYRYTWPLAVALMKVRDPIHRGWIKAQVRRAGVLFSNLGLPPRVVNGDASPEVLFLEYDKSNALDLTG